MILDVKGPVVANSLYCDNTQVAKDVKFTLPEITFKTAEISSMGTMTVPLLGLIENMETTITKIGLDTGFSKLNKLESLNLEYRWVQTSIDKNGTVKHEGCKAFVKTLPSNIPSVNVEPGSATEVEHKFTVTRLQIFVDGKEAMLIDRLNNLIVIDGTNYTTNINKML